jgi:flagellar biogenesis protein FliO
MKETQFGDLVGRMAISLAVVLGLMFVAYKILKRRQSGGSISSGRPSRRSAMGRSGGQARGLRTRGSASKQGLKVVGRVGLSRNNAVLAVQFGERIFMVGTSEQAPPSVLAEVELSTWTSAGEARIIDEPVRSIRPAPAARPQLGTGRMGFVEALREATARRG